MAAITRHVGAIYAEPEGPMQIPQWNTNHGRLALNLQEAVGIAASATNKGKTMDDSSLSNACIKALKENTISYITEAIQKTGKKSEGYPTGWKRAQGIMLHKKEIGKRSPTTGFSAFPRRPILECHYGPRTTRIQEKVTRRDRSYKF